MPFDSVTPLRFLLAISPIASVLILMVGFRWGGAKAGAVGWLVALAVSLIFYGADTEVLAYSQVRGVMLTLYVLYIIWMALVLYNVVKESGAITVIGQGMVRLTGDRVLQLLILAWVFSAFLQGVAGFGVPIAVVAPLLLGLGFSPVTAVASVAAGHSWSVTFGDIAASFNALIATTGLPGEVLAPWAAGLLGLSCFACGVAAVWAYEGLASLKRGFVAIVLVGTVMSGVQYALAVNGLWNLAGFVAGLAGIAASALVARLAFYRSTSAATEAGAQDASPRMPFTLAVGAYIILILVVGAAELVGPVHIALNAYKIQLQLPATQTALGWTVESGMTKGISLFGHAGALLAYTSIAGYVLYRLTGRYTPGALGRILSNTVGSAVKSSIGIASMVGFAMMMDQTGMTYLLAIGLSRTLESAFPFLSPFIGLLGAFMTGSNTNSNVVFAGLQQQTAALLGLPATVILAAQTTGGSLGSMLAPAKIIVGCSTAGLAGEEGQVLRRTIVYGILISALIGIVTWLAVQSL